MKVVMILFVILAACSQEAQVHNLSPQEANELMEKKAELGLFVMNVHAPYEGKLDSTDAIIEDWENIATHQDQLPKDKNAPILVYCRSGRMSLSAVEQMKTLGYTNIYHLDGGMRAWADAGLPLIDKKFQ